MKSFINGPIRASFNSKTLLGQKYPMTELTYDSATKERILLESAALFAKNGYHNVSVKDIASVVGIKPASIYNHYECKEALWDAVLERIYELSMVYYSRLDDALASAKTFEDVVDALLFEHREGSQPFIARGMCLVQAEQFHNARACEMFNDVFVEFATEYSMRCFSECIEQGMCESFDARSAAMAFTSSIIVLTAMRVQEYEGEKPPFDVDESFDLLRSSIIAYAKSYKPDAAIH